MPYMALLSCVLISIKAKVFLLEMLKILQKEMAIIIHLFPIKAQVLSLKTIYVDIMSYKVIETGTISSEIEINIE